MLENYNFIIFEEYDSTLTCFFFLSPFAVFYFNTSIFNIKIFNITVPFSGS